MSKYSVQLRQLVDTYGYDEVCSWFENYDLSDYLTNDEIEVIEERGTWTKRKLSKAIVDHYYMREIGAETPNLFRHYARVLMREIMEEKAPLIYSTAIKYDPLVNVDYHERFQRDTTSRSNTTSNTSGLAVNSDTPQGRIDKQEVLQGKYASSTGASEATDSSTANGSGNENYDKHVIGNSGVSATAQHMIQQYREVILTINRDIIKEVDELFMGIY